jgi:hypothetical protein
MQKTTKTIKGSTDQIVTYNGQVLWVNKGSWRLKAAISTTTRVNAAGSYSSGDKIPYGLIRPCPTSFSSTLPDPTAGICGSLSATTGDLQYWDGATSTWKPYAGPRGSMVSFTITLFDGGQLKSCRTTGSGKKATTTCTYTDQSDWFGIQFDELPTSAIRESFPVPLKGGSLKVS